MKFHWPLYSDIIFFVDNYSAGVSNKHCVLPFFFVGIFSLRIMQWVLLVFFHYALCNGF